MSRNKYFELTPNILFLSYDEWMKKINEVYPSLHPEVKEWLHLWNQVDKELVFPNDKTRKLGRCFYHLGYFDCKDKIYFEDQISDDF